MYFFERSKVIVNKVLEAKLKEIEAGVDGFMVYDSRIVPYVNEVRICLLHLLTSPLVQFAVTLLFASGVVRFSPRGSV